MTDKPESPSQPKDDLHTSPQVSPEIQKLLASMGVPKEHETAKQKLPQYTPQDIKREASEVQKLLAILHKSYQAFSFYPFNHPIVKQFSDQLHQALEHFFRHAPYLELRLDRFRILFYDEVVFEERNVNNNFVYLLYSDGIRKLMFYAGLSLEECFRFFAILHQCSGRRSLYDDVVTLMWEESFEHIRYFLVEDLCAALLPSFAASGDDPDDEEEKKSDGPAVRLSRTKAPPSNSQLAFRTIQQLSKTRLQLTPEETQKLDQLLFEEEQELMHRFLELMTLIIKNHRESHELEQLIRVLQQLQPIIIAVGAIEDMLLCFRYIGHLAEDLSHRGTPMAIGWSQALQRVLPEAYSEHAIRRLFQALEAEPQEVYVQTIVAQYIQFIHPPTPDLLLLALEQINSQQGTQLWCRILAHKYQQHPRKLMQGILSSQNKVVTGTCVILGLIGKEEAWPLLERASHHSEKKIRIQALRSMLRVSSSEQTTPKLLPLLEKHLAESDAEIRIVAIEGLIKLGPNALNIVENLFHSKAFEQWSQEELTLFFKHVAHLCSYYAEIAEQLIQLLLQHYSGRFQSKQKQKIPRLALQALQRENTPQTAQVIERLYQQAAKPLKRICEELFHH